MEENPEIDAYWRAARAAHPELPDAVPEAWGFGATPEHADSLLELVLAGVKTGTASSLWDYEATDEPLPAEGDYSIILDGAGSPRAVIQTISVRTVPFDQVGAEHAFAEGEGDRTLRAWRHIHEQYWRENSENPRGYEPDMPVVCEIFRVVHPS
ncbi:ASCH domain-containing protein [Microbacterium sp. NPDC057659]|uniref:ASCH domain-containing protein n=1 Tax=Microbacterium sp. NPDC057659 TaxID=3346198 RepID=UPI00366B79A1